MKKILASLTLALLFGLTVRAQDTNLPPQAATNQVVGFLDGVLNTLRTGTNFMFIADGIITTGDNGKYGGGGGIALAYNITKYAALLTRLDYLNKAFYQGSLSAQLQLPMFNDRLVTFAGGGVAIPFGGGADNPASVQGVAMVGAAFKVSGHFYLLMDAEWWSATKGQQYRVGAGWTF